MGEVESECIFFEKVVEVIVIVAVIEDGKFKNERYFKSMVEEKAIKKVGYNINAVVDLKVGIESFKIKGVKVKGLLKGKILKFDDGLICEGYNGVVWKEKVSNCVVENGEDVIEDF